MTSEALTTVNMSGYRYMKLYIFHKKVYRFGLGKHGEITTGTSIIEDVYKHT